jgi:aminoglycoside phosphotransferase (APT) family kinase protein
VVNLSESVSLILEKEFESAEDFDVEPLGSGASHETFSAVSEDRELVVKICDDDWSGLPEFEKGFELDAPVLKLVREETSIPVPEVYAYDNSETEFNFKYIVMERVEGKEMYEFMEYSENQHLIRQTGELLGELHNKIEFEDFGGLKATENDFVEVEPQEWSSMFKQLIWKITSHLEKIEAQETRDRIRNIVEENLHLLESRDNPVLLHQEFSPRNMVGTSEGINAVIDWERAISGDPEYDLATAEKHIIQARDGNPEKRENAEQIRKILYEGYKSKRQLDQGWEKRRNLYYLPYITLMMYITANREENIIEVELLQQLEKIEEEL